MLHQQLVRCACRCVSARRALAIIFAAVFRLSRCSSSAKAVCCSCRRLQLSNARILRRQGVISAFAQVLLFSSNQLNGAMHVRKTRFIVLFFFGETSRQRGKQGGFIVLDLLSISVSSAAAVKRVSGFCLRSARGYGAGAKLLQHFSTEACRIIRRRRANQ